MKKKNKLNKIKLFQKKNRKTIKLKLKKNKM